MIMLYLLHSLDNIFRTKFSFLDVCIPGKTSFDEVYNKMSVRNDYDMCILNLCILYLIKCRTITMEHYSYYTCTYNVFVFECQ